MPDITYVNVFELSMLLNCNNKNHVLRRIDKRNCNSKAKRLSCFYNNDKSFT